MTLEAGGGVGGVGRPAEEGDVVVAVRADQVLGHGGAALGVGHAHLVEPGGAGRARQQHHRDAPGEPFELLGGEARASTTMPSVLVASETTKLGSRSGGAAAIRTAYPAVRAALTTV